MAKLNTYQRSGLTSRGNLLAHVFSLPAIIAMCAMLAVRPAALADLSTLLNPAHSPLVAQTLDGQSLDLSQVPGWRVIYFWSTACPCVKACERYSFVPLAQKYKGRVAFYAVASNSWDLSMPHAQLAQAIAAHHLPYPVLLDPTHSIALYLQARVTPETFVLDPQGHVVFAGMPDDSRRFLFQDADAAHLKQPYVPKTYLSRALAEALAGRPITPSPIKYAGCIIAW